MVEDMPDFEDKVEREDAPPAPALSSSLLIDMDEEPPASAPNAAELQGEAQHDTSRMDVTSGGSAQVDVTGNITSPFAPCQG
jgi:hypothetical protein